jgi:hypothetical protein
VNQPGGFLAFSDRSARHGLLISKATKDQLVAGQIAIIARVIAKEHPMDGDYNW